MGRASQARVNVSENCYNPVCASCRRAEALGYPGRSPPAQAMTDYFFKDHIKSNTTHRSAKASQFSVLGSQSSVLSPQSSLLTSQRPQPDQAAPSTDAPARRLPRLADSGNALHQEQT